MPIRRRTLTQAERTEDLVRAEQLRASGVDIEILEKWRERNRIFDVMVAPATASTVCEFRTGGIGYAPFVRLEARAGLTITDVDITTKWDDQIVLESFLDGPICRLLNAEYRPSEILNQRIENGLRLSRGKTVEGYILATGLWRIPKECGDFAVPFNIVFTNSMGQQFRADGMLSVVRQVQRGDAECGKGQDCMAWTRLASPESCPRVKSRGADTSNCSPRKRSRANTRLLDCRCGSWKRKRGRGRRDFEVRTSDRGSTAAICAHWLARLGGVQGMKPEPGGRSVASRKSDVPRADESWMLTCGMKREDDWVPLLIAQMQLDAAKSRANPKSGTRELAFAFNSGFFQGSMTL